jgi:hypothetical protein
MPVPPNITDATAISLSDPTSITQDVRDSDTGIVYTVWYKYTETVKDRVIDFKFYGIINGGATTYRPATFVYDSQSFAFTSTIANCQGQLPIQLGHTYYFEVFRNSASLSAAILNIEFLSAPDTDPIPSGSIFIRAASIPQNFIDDEGFTGLPGGFINASTDSIIGFRPFFICGESGDILPTTGRMLFADEFGSLAPFPGANQYNMYLYNNDFTLNNSFVFDAPGGFPLIRTHNPSNKFYIYSRGSAPSTWSVLRSVSSTGVVGAAETITGALGATAIAVNAAETICYIAGIGGSIVGSDISRWDIVNDTFLSDLAPVESGHRVTDMLVLSDDSIVAMYFNPTTKNIVVRRYDTAGATLGTYTPSLTGTVSIIDPRLGYASGSPESFWTFFHVFREGGLQGWSVIRKIRVSDMSVLVDSETRDSGFEFWEAAGVPFALTSDSCPIIELRAAVEPPPPTTYYPGIYVIVPGKTDDTVNDGGTPLDLKIPDPTFKTGLLG